MLLYKNFEVPPQIPTEKQKVSLAGSALFFIEETKLRETMRIGLEGPGLKPWTVEHHDPDRLLAGTHTTDTEFVQRFNFLSTLHSLSNPSPV